MNKILIIEDNKDYREFMVRILTREGYAVTDAISSVKGLEILAKERFTLVISDLHLDVLNGISILRTAKEIDPSVKTMILTGEPGSSTELDAIEYQVDAYVEKNRSGDVVLAYIKKILSEYENKEQKHGMLYSQEENIELDLRARSVKKDDEYISLTPKEYGVLKVLLENKPEVVSREELIKEVWYDQDISENSRVIDVQIQKLREKLKSHLIMSIRGKGYKWYE